jgi:molybdenum cofactor synthesis domain-containing protein
VTSTVVSAGLVVIGDEVLSGRTQDIHVATLARFLQPLGIVLHEVRMVPDVQDAIVEAVNALRARFTYVFTTGGIGPTHDDITADAIAAAFGVGIDVRDDARAILEAHYRTGLNEARLRMARIPEGATLIHNPVSAAPGFQTGNVFTLAGVPSVMRGMLEDVLPRLVGGAVIGSVTVRGPGLREGDLSAPLAALAAAMPDVSFGSYPWFNADGFGAEIVARASDPARLEAAHAAVIALARDLIESVNSDH